MTEYRIVTNGYEFRVQELRTSGWFRPTARWANVYDNSYYPEPLTFRTNAEASGWISDTQRERMRTEASWEPVA